MSDRATLCERVRASLREALALMPMVDASPGMATICRQRYMTLRELGIALLTETERRRLPAEADTTKLMATRMAEIVIRTEDLLTLLKGTPH